MRLSSCQARNTFPLMAGLARYLQGRLNWDTAYEDTIPWPERYGKLYTGELDLVWICARPYALQIAEQPRKIFGIAAPVMRESLYDGQPVYYSHLVVHEQNQAAVLPDLRGARVAYNEPGSQSGFFSLLTALAAIGEQASFFADWVESGGHLLSLAMLQARTIDVAAIDSTVWDYEQIHNPHSLANLKIIATTGPFPGPPLAASSNVSTDKLERLTEFLLAMHQSADGRALLAQSGVSHFLPVNDADYRSLLEIPTADPPDLTP
jgi:ABC-type phosphate/phosphonate transport system substrate-binding protein